jgi:hypothetical protein
MLEGALAPSALDEYAAHGPSRSGEEVGSAIPVLTMALADQAQVCLVNEGSGLVERMPWRLVCHSVGCESAQVVIDERQELGSLVRIAAYVCLD